MEYKDTLNLPKTDFPMKADLPKREPLFLEEWGRRDIYKLVCEKSKANQKYVLHDGPPYANGDIHIGHALNKTLKDIIVKYKTMRGFNAAYVPGWDCHGLPIEHQLFKELKIAKTQIRRVLFRKKAYEYAMHYVAKQKEQFKRLGVFGDWENPYLTLSRPYEEAIVAAFSELCKRGYIQRGLKPVNWCYNCETALAEAEVEYLDHTSPSVYIKFKLEEKEGYLPDSYLVIWTTTPWTLLANVAVALHPNLTYSYIKTAQGNLILASDLLSKVLSEVAIEKYELIKELNGSQLEGLIYRHPFRLRKGRVVLADYVSRQEGTGLVHIAPGHGMEDFLTGIKYNLEVVMPVDARGNFDHTCGEFAEKNVFAANKAIIEKLATLKVLLATVNLQHSYPHCWRCKNPVIFRATKQWFLMIDHEDLRSRLLQAIEKVEWFPATGKERISAMVALRPDWCLSRQRYWGVPLPALVCESCHEEFLSVGVIEKFVTLIAREGSDCWLERELQDFIPTLRSEQVPTLRSEQVPTLRSEQVGRDSAPKGQGTREPRASARGGSIGDGLRCPYCQATRFSKGKDILDVWFDSGVSYRAVLEKREELGGIPCQLYLEGSDQHRGWFQSSLIPAIALEGKPPFKAVLTHGHVVDSAGRKMSKSLGNVISPHDIIKDYGADILRLWVASSDYSEDIRISREMLARLSEAYRKIRNTARFILSNLYDFNPAADKITYANLKQIDKWALSKANSVLNKITAAYESFRFQAAYKEIYDFCNETLSMSYLDMIKGRLYTYAKQSPERRSAQTTIYEILNMLVRMMAPILVFTAEEIWRHMPAENTALSVSVHLLDWPECQTLPGSEEFCKVMDLIPDINKLLEEKRSQGLIGSSFDAQINLLTNNPERYKFLESLKGELCEIFKVSQVEVLQAEVAADSPTGPKAVTSADIAIEVFKAKGKRCIRCWNYSQGVGEHPGHNLLCNNCLKAIGGR